MFLLLYMYFFFNILYIFLIFFFPIFICDSCQWITCMVAQHPWDSTKDSKSFIHGNLKFFILLVFFFGLIKNIYNCSTLIVDMMKRENLFASQGGPIILSQVSKLYLVFIVFVKVIFKIYIYKNICMKFLFIYFEIFILLWLSRVIITIIINLLFANLLLLLLLLFFCKLVIVVVECLIDWKWVWEYYGPVWRGWKGIRELVC